MSIKEKFEELVREKMTDEQFWKWVSTWKDPAEIIDEALEWDKNYMEDTITSYENKEYDQK